jgi:hypothetical protein
LGGDGRRRRRRRGERKGGVEGGKWVGGRERGKEGGDARRKRKREKEKEGQGKKRREHAKSEHSREVSAQTTTKATAGLYFPGGARSLASPRFAHLTKLTQ